ncbi:MAG TPA: hypothetical protein VIH60_11570 [Steroidobacteraceae bacterium]|jgi:hypothetical protein
MRMRYALIFCLVSSLGLAASPTPPHVSSISPIFHQLVVFSLPPEFTSPNAAYERTNGSFYIREHVPQGETVEHWTQMITVTGTKDLASNQNATPRGFVSRLANGFATHCPDTFATADLGPQMVGDYQGYALIASCGHVQSGAASYSETAIVLAFKGSADYYTIQWARHGADSKHPLTLDNTYWSKQFDRLRPIRLCAIVPGEAAPYPSCVGNGN